MNLKDKIVVITGGSSGIGAASAQLFASHGAKVIITDIDESRAKILIDKLKNAGGEVSFLNMNVAKFEDVHQGLNEVVQKFGRIDILVNNAGIANKEMVKIAEHSLEEWDKVIAVNQTGVFYGLKAALKIMHQQGHGNIVNVASLAGLKASGNNIAYSASKFAVVGMTKSAALEYASYNIRVNCVCPGYTKTPLLDKVFEEKPKMEEILLSYIPMKRYGEVEEIAKSIVWLASDESSFITGHALTLDGGLSL